MDERVKIFGILNVTPDSFSDGGQFIEPEKALTQARNLIDDGADFIDIGGQSTRPGAAEISWQEEWGRVERIIQILFGAHGEVETHGHASLPPVGTENVQPLREQAYGNTPLPERISLDTKHPDTARAFLAAGGTILNDVSGFQDPRMVELAPEFQLVIVNHFPGETIDEVHEQNISSINQVRDDLFTKKEELIRAGVTPEKIVLDPGIGFGKTMELNWQLLEFARLVPNEKVMIGHSKKRFLGEQRFDQAPNVAAARAAIESGAWALRVHEPGWV